MSLSNSRPQCGQLCQRSRSSFGTRFKHSEQCWEVPRGSTSITKQPALSALKLSISLNWLHPASAMLLFSPDFADCRLGRNFPVSSCLGLARLDIFLTLRASTKTTSALLRSFLAVSKWNCLRCLATFWCKRATLRYCLFFALLFFFRAAALRCKRASFSSDFLKCCGIGSNSFSESARNFSRPRSMPMLFSQVGIISIAISGTAWLCIVSVTYHPSAFVRIQVKIVPQRAEQYGNVVRWAKSQSYQQH